MQYIVIKSMSPLNIPRNQRLKEEYYNPVLSIVTGMISDKSSQLKSTKEDSKKSFNSLATFGYSKVVATLFQHKKIYNNVVTTLF